MSDNQDKKVITREDLQKSLADLDPKKDDTTEETVEKSIQAEEVAEETKLTKSSTDAVKDEGSDDLKKTINASQAMADFVNLVCKTNDTNLETLVKAINGNHEVGTALVKAVVDHNTKLDALTKTVETIADKMDLPRESKASVGKDDVLEKNVSGQDTKVPDKQDLKPGEMKKRVTDAMGALHKSIYKSGDEDKAARLAQKIVEFDTTSDPEVLGDEFLQPTIDIMNGKNQ